MIAEMPADRLQKIEKRTAELIDEELNWRALRRARQLTRAKLARKLGIPQSQVSESERRTDVHISTLRSQIQAMGGSLTLTATFPERAPVRLVGLGDF